MDPTLKAVEAESYGIHSRIEPVDSIAMTATCIVSAPFKPMHHAYDIRSARSFPGADRWVKTAELCERFGISRRTLSKYVKGGYRRAGGEWYAYTQGPMPHKRLPGGSLRFNVKACEEWLDAGN